MREFTKLERRMLDLTRTEAYQIASLWRNGRDAGYPYRWTAKGRSLEGTSRRKFLDTLRKIGLFPEFIDARVRDSEGEIEMGNSAPRGGQVGKFLRLTPTGYRKIQRVLTD